METLAAHDVERFRPPFSPSGPRCDEQDQNDSDHTRRDRYRDERQSSEVSDKWGRRVDGFSV